jgi:cytochrome c
MKSISKLIILSILAASNLLASSSNDVENLVNKAYAFCEKEGLDNCIKSFNNRNLDFIKDDLYIFVSEFNGMTLAHAGNSKLVGKNLSKVKSPSGLYPTIEFAKIGKTTGSGWVNYKWSHPLTREITDKSTFVKRFKDQEIVIGSGYYK